MCVVTVCVCACVERVNVYMYVYLHVALHKAWLSSPAKCSGGCQSLGDTVCAVCVQFELLFIGSCCLNSVSQRSAGQNPQEWGSVLWRWSVGLVCAVCVSICTYCMLNTV